MSTMIVKVERETRNYVAKDLRTPKYRMRVVADSKKYNRAKQKSAHHD